MTYTDNEKFNNHIRMRWELREAGVVISCELPEADLVYQYNLQFLANTFEYQNESRELGINRTRNAKGKFR